jgi:hypothetical protein
MHDPVFVTTMLGLAGLLLGLDGFRHARRQKQALVMAEPHLL